MDFVVILKRSAQIGPDQFDTWMDTLICKPTTSLAEIAFWASSRTKTTEIPDFQVNFGFRLENDE